MSIKWLLQHALNVIAKAHKSHKAKRASEQVNEWVYIELRK